MTYVLNPIARTPSGPWSTSGIKDDQAIAVSLYAGIAGFRRLKSEWDRLTSTDCRYWIKYPFFEESLLHAIEGETGLLFAACLDRMSGRVVAIVPIRTRVMSIRRVRFRCAEVVGSSFDDVSGQASSADFPAESLPVAILALAAVVRALRHCSERPSLLMLGRVFQESYALRAALTVHEVSRSHAQRGGVKWIDVDRPFAEIHSALSGKFRISLRSSLRNLAALGKVEFITIRRTDEEFQHEFKTFLSVEASGWKGMSGTATGLLVNAVPNQREFLQSIAFRSDLAESELHALTVNGRRIASQFWLRHGSTRVAFKIGYLEEFSRFQPGHLLTQYVLQQSCADPGIKVIDFVSDAAWLDKWRVSFTPHHFHYLPIRRLHGKIANWLLLTPSIERLRERIFRK